MLEALADFYDAASIIDILYLIITILSLIKCYKKGFVLKYFIYGKMVAWPMSLHS
jgi:membrane protein required for colicin V production